MNKGEIAKWNMIDIGGYNSTITVFVNYLSLIEENITKSEYTLLELFSPIRDRLDRLSSRFSEIDLYCLDYKYPVDELGAIKYVLLPAMDKHLCQLEGLIKQFDKQKDTNIACQILDLANLSDSHNDLLTYYGKQINNCPGYREYRKKFPARKYLYEI